MTLPKTFAKDHVVRDRKGMPVGRIILRSEAEYTAGEPVNVALLTVPASVVTNIKALVLYLDGHPYKVPADLPKIRILTAQGRHRVNSFVLEPVKP